LNDFKNRLDYYPDKNPVMLYFGDFDPSGVEMLESIEITLKDELGASGIEFKRIALTREDIYKNKLPHSPDALKRTDTRAKGGRGKPYRYKFVMGIDDSPINLLSPEELKALIAEDGELNIQISNNRELGVGYFNPMKSLEKPLNDQNDQ